MMAKKKVLILGNSHLVVFGFRGELIERLIQEGNEGHNRVDMRLVNRKGRNYIVQVECKRDLNAESLYSGLTEQLIDKYFTSGIYLGVYLVFCFKKDASDNSVYL